MSLFTTADIQALLSKYKAEGYEPFNAAAYAAKYLQGNSEEQNAFPTPLEHYLKLGAARGYNPLGNSGPLFFDAEFYAAKYPALAQSGVTDAGDLFGHFLKFGVAEGRQASAYTNNFDAARYLKDYPEIAAYVNEHLSDFNGSAANGALAHFMKFGQAQGFLAFDTNGVAFTKSGFPLTQAITFNNGVLDLDTNEGNTTLTAAAAPVVAPANGALRLSGDADVRIDLTQPNKQVFGIDLDGNGEIKANGIENNVSGANILKTSGFNILDAYARNPLNEFDRNKNFLGDIKFDGASYQGDGVKTNGNIFLGGLGADVVQPGVGNDFIAGGGVAGQNSGHDDIQGGRNADFIYVELSRLQNTDGNDALVDGGFTADDNQAGNVQSAQDTDWLLLEAQDDEEPVTVRLEDALADENGNGNLNDDGSVTTASGKSLGAFRDVENVDASGNLYGFLNDYDVELGGRRLDDRDKAGTANYGLGSSAQLNVIGSIANNRIIGGYDNDNLQGNAGNDLLFGGNLQFFKETVKDGVTNPNLDKIAYDGIDRLDGGDGNDGLVLELDGGGFADNGGGGVYGGAGNDTLYLTNYTVGREGATEAESAAKILKEDIFQERKIRIDLGYETYQGYRFDTLGEQPKDPKQQPNAETDSDYVPGTADQTVYDKHSATKIVGIENIIASGMGGLDYLAAGTNKPELKFANQQNFFGAGVNLELRGTDALVDPVGGNNVLYASSGNDFLEGRSGNDSLSGGGGNDTFIFSLRADGDTFRGDNVDVIHRQNETAPGSNLWDGTFGQDFGKDSTSQVGASELVVDFLTTKLSEPNVAVGGFAVKIGGVVFNVPNSDALNQAVNAQEVAALVSAAFNAQDKNVSAFAVGNTVHVIDALGRDISDEINEGFGVVFIVSDNGKAELEATFNEAAVVKSQDRIVYKAYEDRFKNEGVDDDATVGSGISLGLDSYAEDLVISFTKEANGIVSTRLAESQQYDIKFTDLAVEDIVKVTVNAVEYTLQVGVNLDGSLIPNESNNAFVTRLAQFINSFNDDDTAAGAVDAQSVADTLRLTQRAYNGEETVFMSKPVVSINNLSGGLAPVSAVTNTSEHEVQLLDFDGRDGALNKDNVLFVGEEFYNRAVLQTAKNAGGTVAGSDAMVVYVQNNNNVDNINSAAKGQALNGGEIEFNKTVNKATGQTENFAVHGDDFLIGGSGADTILGGTGDDRIVGSGGNDTADGGKDLWLQDGEIKVYNDFDAAQAAKQPGVISLQKIRQLEKANSPLVNGFEDTLQFQQTDFGSNARFTITLDADLTRKNGGAGTVAIDANGDGTLDAGQLTKFTNFEHIRTVSGTGKAVAGVNGGQGQDTLDVAALSTLTGGITYILTNGSGIGAAGQVYINTGENFQHAPVNGDADPVGSFGVTEPGQPVNLSDDKADDALYNTVDGVETVVGGLGNDTLVIDETEAAKDNAFIGGLGLDAVVYEDNYPTKQAVPTVTFKVGAADVDHVEQTDGRNGQVLATDTLSSVESVDQRAVPVSSRENDVLDVTDLANGAAVDFVQSKVFTAAGVEQVQLFGMSEYENVKGSAGSDIVIVSDTMFNSREDVSDLPPTPAAEIRFNSFLNFDFINDFADANNDGKADDKNGDNEVWDRQSIEELRVTTAGQANPWWQTHIPKVVNQNQFTFDLGAGINDTVDYSAETGSVVAVINFNDNPTQYVMVDHNDLINVDVQDNDDRIDALKGVENIVAGRGTGGVMNNVIDLTQSNVDVNVRFSFGFPAVPVEGKDKITALDREIHLVRITQQLNENLLGNINLIDYRDLTPLDPDPKAIDQVEAQWNVIEGSDKNEYVEFTDAESKLDHTARLRGGNNEANYNELFKSIHADIKLTAFDSKNPDPLATGIIKADVDFKDALGVIDPNLGEDTITSHTAGNLIAAGSLRIEASQAAFDSFKVDSADGVDYTLGTVNDTIIVGIDENGVNNAMTLTGFEILQDGPSNDVYFIDNLLSVKNTLELVDALGDRDTIQVTDKAVVGNLISLENINMTFLNKANTSAFDFDVLDITKVTKGNLTVLGDFDGFFGNRDTTLSPNLPDTEADDLVLGDLSKVSTIGGFQDLYLTDASIKSSGSSYQLDTVTADLRNGNGNSLFTTDAGGFGNLARGLDASMVTTGGVTLKTLGTLPSKLVGSAQDDTLTGGGGKDTIEGGKGKDVLDGGTATETQSFGVFGILNNDGKNASYTIVLRDANDNPVPALVVNEGPGAQDIPFGAFTDTIGLKLAERINAYAAGIGNVASVFDSAVYDSATDNLTIKYKPGVNYSDVTIMVALNGDPGPHNVTPAVTLEQGGSGGNDHFVFRHGDSTLKENTADVINGFVSGSDTLRFYETNGTTAVTGIDAGPGTNYYEGAGPVTSFQQALDAANAQLLDRLANDPNISGGTLFSFQWDVVHDKGYLFQDYDNDGKVDQVVILTGIDNTEIDGNPDLQPFV